MKIEERRRRVGKNDKKEKITSVYLKNQRQSEENKKKNATCGIRRGTMSKTRRGGAVERNERLGGPKWDDSKQAEPVRLGGGKTKKE